MGAGAWGSTFAGICADAGGDVTLWARRSDLARTIERTSRNPDYLRDLPIHPGIRVTEDVADALAGAAIVVLAVPSHALPECLERWRPHVPSGAVALSLVKGISVDTLQRASEVVGDLWDLPEERVTVLSGPNLARECAQRMPAATVVAGLDPEVTARVAAACHTDYFRVYTNTDLIGVELGGAIKNPLAIAAGIVDGLELGDNAKATLLTRGLAEMMRLGLALGGTPLTFSGLAGVGDLMATCASPQSRNRHVGEQLGRGHTLAEVMDAMGGQAGGDAVSGVPEGVRSSRAIMALADRAGVEMPIIEQVVRVVHDGVDPREVAGALMGRSPRPEFHGIEEDT
ncbi:NAD(P)H-dependent glycerol-3-phosphate dehydrogenase [soil metagenome]